MQALLRQLWIPGINSFSSFCGVLSICPRWTVSSRLHPPPFSHALTGPFSGNRRKYLVFAQFYAILDHRCLQRALGAYQLKALHSTFLWRVVLKSGFSEVNLSTNDWLQVRLLIVIAL